LMPEPAFRLPNLDVPEEIIDLLSPAMALTIYFKAVPSRFRDGVIACWQEFLADHSGELSWYADEDIGKFHSASRKRLSRPVQRLLSDKPMSLYAWKTGSGATHDGAGAIGFDCLVRDPSQLSPQMRARNESKDCFLRVSFPASAFQSVAKLEAFVAMARRWTERLPFVHGYGGLSLNITGAARPGQLWDAQALPIIRRYPGFDWEDCQGTTLCVHGAIRGVNWLTILCGDLVARLGGADALSAKLPHPVTLHEASGGGVIVQAGGAPGAGDAEQGDRLPVYGIVSRVLSPICITEEPYTCLPPEWLRRFG
jgi:Protein of unknown function (DUF3396)